MAAAHQKIIKEYVKEGWEVIYLDGSSETHPEAGMVGLVYFFRCGFFFFRGYIFSQLNNNPHKKKSPR